MNDLKEIDKFYFVIGGVLLALVLLVVIVIRGIFSSVSVARQIDQSYLESQTPKLNKENLDRAIDIIERPQTDVLDLAP